MRMICEYVKNFRRRYDIILTMKLRLLRTELIFSLLIVLLPLTYTHCGGSFVANSSSSGSFQSLNSTSCPIISNNLSDLKSVEDAVALINALPKPLSIDCFIANLKIPLKVFAVNNTFSAQPSVSMDSPRIFIISNNLILSVVPAGEGKNLVEFSQIVSSGVSIKAEIEFPISATLPGEAPYSRILSGSFGTTCTSCHKNESRATMVSAGEAYQSNIIAPDLFQRVSQGYLLNQAKVCNNRIDDFRCRLLKTIFIRGAAVDVDFPN